MRGPLKWIAWRGFFAQDRRTIILGWGRPGIIQPGNLAPGTALGGKIPMRNFCGLRQLDQ